MAITRTVTQVYSGPSTAGAILAPARDLGTGLGVPASMSGTYSQSPTNPAATIFGGDTTANVTAYCGYRVVNSMNLSTSRYVTFSAAHSNFARHTLATWANGGLRIVFEDAAGNWSAFNLYGSDLAPFGGGGDGAFASFLGFGNNTDTSNQVPAWYVDRSRTPVASSGTLDWATIAAFEVHFRPASSGRMQLALGRFATVDLPIHTGTVSSVLGVFRDILGAMAAPAGSLWPLYWVSRLPAGLLQTVSPKLATTTIGFQCGNGSATTTLTIASHLVSFWPLPEQYSSTVDAPNGVMVIQDTRLIDIFQSATDNVTFSNSTFTGLSLWGFRLRGTPGVFSASICSFVRYAEFAAAHGSYTDCMWDGGTGAIEVTASTTITRGTVRNGTNGIKITSGAAAYANLNIAFSNQSLYDIECGSGGAGTYSLSGISVVGAYTLKIRNDSATNAITVEIPAGIAYTTSTAGGSITISTPATYQSVTINGLVSGSRLQIYDMTSSTELANVSTGTSYTWTDANPAVSSRDIRVRIAYQSGVTAKYFIEAAIGTAGTSGSNAAVSYLANQTDDTVYNANAIDGSAVTGITISDGIDRLVINIAGGSVSWPQIYAYNVYWLATSAGVVDDGSIITASDTANYSVTLFKIRNSSTTPLNITGGYGRDSTTGTVGPLIDTAGSTGNIYQTPDHVIPYQTTGTYAITGDPTTVAAAVLSAAAANPIAADIRKVNNLTISGSGTSESPWGP